MLKTPGLPMRLCLIFMLLCLAACKTVTDVPILPLTPVPTLDHTREKAPYLFYYSALDDAFIVERADGTDGTIIGQNVSKDSGRLIGTSWSPSGEWLAWWGNQSLHVQAHYWVKDVSVVRLDGSGQRKIFNLPNPDAISIVAIEWAPNQDWLLIGYSDPGCNSGIFHARIFDVSQNRVIYDAPLQTSLNYCGSIDILHLYRLLQWASDGQAFAYRYVLEDGSVGYVVTQVPHEALTASVPSVGKSKSAQTGLFFSLIKDDPLMGWQVTDPFLNRTMVITKATQEQIEYAIRSEAFRDFFVTTNVTEIQGDDPTVLHFLEDPDWTAGIRQLKADNLYPPSPRLQELLPSLDLSQARGIGTVYIKKKTALMVWEVQEGYLLAIYNLETRRVIKQFAALENSISFWGWEWISPNGRYVALEARCPHGPSTVTDEGETCLIDVQTGQEHIIYPGTISSARYDRVYGYIKAWHPIHTDWVFANGGVLNISNGFHRPVQAYEWLPESEAIDLIPPREQPLYPRPYLLLLAPDGNSANIAWSPDGKYMTTCSRDKGIYVWEVAKNERIADTHLENMSSMCFVEWIDHETITNGHSNLNLRTSLIVTEEAFGVVTIIPGPRPTQTEFESLAESHGYSLYDGTSNYRNYMPQISSDKDYMVVVIPDDYIKGDRLGVFDAQKGDVVHEFDYEMYRSQLLFSPDSRYVAELQRTYIRVYDLATWRLIVTFPASGREIRWSPDSRYIATASSTGAYIWEVPTP